MSNESVIIEASRPAVLPPPHRAVPECEVSISCYDSVPPTLGPELDQLYHHIASSLNHHVIARRAQNAHAYVARRGKQPLAIFLFELEKRSIVVFTEMMQVAPEEIDRFATYVFGRFPSVARVSFSKIGKDISRLALPSQQYGGSEDIVVTLPATPDAYLSSLGSKTRYNIKHQMKGITADFPGFSFHTYEKGAIAAEHVTRLIDLKKSTIDEKRIKFGITPEDTAWMIELARTRGLLVVGLLDGKVCGGSLSFSLGDHYFAYVNGFDARFAKYSLGMLCCYLAMTETIQRGAKEAHLLWGRNPYKFKLLGVQRDMVNLDIYRSRMTYYLHTHRVCRNALRDAVDRQKAALIDSAQRSGALPPLASRIIKTARSVKRSLFRPGN